MFYCNFDSLIAEKYYESIRSLEIGALMAVVSLSALNVTASTQQFLAGVVVVGFIIAIYARGSDFRKINKRYLAGFKNLRDKVHLATKSGSLVISLTVLWLMMLGEFNLDLIIAAIGL